MPHITTDDGVSIHYEIEGRDDGPPLLFSHPLGANLSLWDNQAQEAAGLGFRVIRFDHRGHGGSDAPEGDYKLERLGKDVLDLLDALGVQQTAYCGLSMGGMVGIWLAMHHPRRFSRLALCSIAVFTPPREMWDERIKAVSEGGTAAVAESVLERWLTQDFRENRPEEVERVRAMILGTDPVGYAGGCAAVRDIDLRDRLGLIESPVLVVSGAQDAVTPPERGQYVVERVPGAQKAVLDTAHLSSVENPEEFNRIVLGFLAGERR